MRNESSRRNFLAGGLSLSAQGGLKYRMLGKTGMKVTALGYGCMLTSDGSVIERALDMGVNFFDTARSYQSGNNERMVGAALKSKRKSIFLTSKSGGKTKQAVLEDLDTSLQTIGTDYLDVWYLHAKGGPADVPDELFEAQQQAKKAGKIRFAGVSTHANMAQFIPWLVKRGQTDVILTSYNFTVEPAVADAIKAARRAGVGIVGMKVMAGGYARIRRGDRLYGGIDPKKLEGTLRQDGAMLAALKWAMRNESVDTIISSMTDIDELEENFRAMSSPFTGSDEKLLMAHSERIRPVYCNMCGDCTGACQKGLPVSDILRILSYAEGYGQFPLARERYRELPAEAAAVHCGECDDCTVNCPRGIQVARRMSRAQELFA